MSLPLIEYCPGILTAGYDAYSRSCLQRMFEGRKVSHVLPFPSPMSDDEWRSKFTGNQMQISISGVQAKYGLVLDKNKLRLAEKGERSGYILKPAPYTLKKGLELPANEHLTMQIARQVFGIETAENALIFFADGEPAYLTRRFDRDATGAILATEDFASLAGRTPQNHGEHFKYNGNYLELFQLLRQYIPAWKVERIKLFRLIVFNYLFSNGDAHFKNFSVLETPLGDFRLSPAYDLLNSRIHNADSDFALEDGLLPRNQSGGTIAAQLHRLGELADIDEKQIDQTLALLTGYSEKVKTLIQASFLSDRTRRTYLQAYQRRLKRISGGAAK